MPGWKHSPTSYAPLRAALGCYRLHLDSTLPPARPVEIVAGLLDDPEVQTLAHKERLDLSAQEFEDAKGFKVVSPKAPELITSPAAAERLFADWKRVYKRDPDIRPIMVREGKRPDTYRRIRKAKRDRVICFRIPRDWPFKR